MAGCGGASAQLLSSGSLPRPQIAISPASASVAASQTETFQASVAGVSNSAVTWQASAGSITSAGVFTAPSTPGQCQVTVTSQADPSLSARATVTVTAPAPPPVTVSVSPAAVNLNSGQSQSFTAAVSGTSNNAVTWTATGGAITPAGAYTASTVAGTFQVTAASVAQPSATASATVTIAAATANTSPRLFPSASADWLYSAPTGSPTDISSMTSSLGFGLHTHQDGFDYPVQYTDGTHGCTNFTDTLIYNFTDHYCVPNPANGYWPSTGAWGADDGHLVVVDTATSVYYDFWKLTVNSQGQPLSTNVGAIFSGSLNGNGTPGTTAAFITGLAGDIMPGELDCVTCLNHALLVVVPGSMNSPGVGDQGPVFHYDGSVPGAVFREGAKIRFDPNIDVNTLNASTATKAVMRALQLYGGLIVDQTGAMGVGFYTSLASPPDETGMNLIGQHLWIYY